MCRRTKSLNEVSRCRLSCLRTETKRSRRWQKNVRSGNRHGHDYVRYNNTLCIPSSFFCLLYSYIRGRCMGCHICWFFISMADKALSKKMDNRIVYCSLCNFLFRCSSLRLQKSLVVLLFWSTIFGRLFMAFDWLYFL